MHGGDRPQEGARLLVMVLIVPVVAGDALTLERAIELAVERHEAPRMAAEEHTAAEARVAAARALFLPSLTATGAYTRRPYATEFGDREIAGRDAWLASGTLTLSVFDARAFPLYRQATLARDAAELAAAEAGRAIAFRAANAFLVTLGFEAVLTAAQRRVEWAMRSLRDARSRAALGLVSVNDVTRAELEAASAEQVRIGAEAGVRSARHELGFVIAAPVQGTLALPKALLDEAIAAPSPAGDVAARAQAGRRDLSAARKTAEAADAAAGEPLARLVPRLGVVGEYHWTSEAGFSGRNVDGYVGVQLSWTLFDGGLTFAERDQAHARAAGLRLRAGELSRQVELETSQAELLLGSAQAAMRQSNAAVEVATRNLREASELYRQGLSIQLAVADANLRLFEAEVELARARYGVAIAFLDVRAAIGLDPFGKEPS